MGMTLPGTQLKPKVSTQCSKNEVVPEFYARDEHGIPCSWVARMRESMARLLRDFRRIAQSVNIPKNTIFRRRQPFTSARRIEVLVGAELVAWQAELAKHWSALRFGPATVEQKGGQYSISGSGFSWRHGPRCRER